MFQVSFAYLARPEHLVLTDCDLRFPPRQTTFVVGRSGSGKSTLGNLILSFYPTNAGSVTIDGNDILDLNASFLRNNVTIVQQQSVLFNESILKNIAFGHQYHENVSYERIEECIDLSEMHTVLASFPDGINTDVGKQGATLSGGQKQRIALARARLRNTPILVLDESISALDHISSHNVMDNIRRWRADKTTIIITHDLSLIKENDVVYILESGRVVAHDLKKNLSERLHEKYSSTSAEESPLESPFRITLGSQDAG
jgi:ATP-binding cassette, subfamily B (MDR/TAP), member 1